MNMILLPSDNEEEDTDLEYIANDTFSIVIGFDPEEVGTRDLIRFLEDTIVTLRRVN